jgi:hypothetical protein
LIIGGGVIRATPQRRRHRLTVGVAQLIKGQRERGCRLLAGWGGPERRMNCYRGGRHAHLESRSRPCHPRRPARDDDGKGGPLYDTILAQDGKLFAAFNTCDMNTLGTMVADDLQFFHDQDGLSVGAMPSCGR